MRIATWNVNSLRVRLDRVLAWLDVSECDVLCIQETKLAQDAFPTDAFSELGYEIAHYGQGQWNGVALASRIGLSDVRRGITGFDDKEARAIIGTCSNVRVMSVYVPNGRSLDDPHYQYKLRWLKALRDDLGFELKRHADLLVGGDFNIAPRDIDVWSIDALQGATHVSTRERECFEDLLNLGMEDLFRKFFSQEQLFTWWDYRGGSFHKRQGMRIDLLLGSASLSNRALWTLIDRNERKGTQPSDHAPVVVEVQA